MAANAPRTGKFRKSIMNAEQVNLNPLPQSETSALPPEQALSALIDGELDAVHFEGLLATAHAETEALASWHSYLVIGDVLRGASIVTSSQPPGDFLADIRERLQAETTIAAVSTSGGLSPVHVQQTVPVGVSAANDAIFRWKLVAGCASLAAVMAVSWSVLSGSPTGTAGASPQFAAAPAISVPPTSPVTSPGTAVVVNTGQGTLIRDARLEELLAEHRQNAGMSALQMPTGFIRNATYDAAGR
jgi:sigma-E factor negative regulatory protein RseA